MHEVRKRTRRQIRTALTLTLLAGGQLTFSVGCVSDILSKYRSPSASPSSSPTSSSAPRPLAAGRGETKSVPGKNNPAPRASIAAVDQGTYRVQSSFDKVWEATLDVLLRNYNLAIADRSNGLITTEWDSYYLDGKVHRNKVSLRLKRVAGAGTEVLVYNNVEVLSKMPDGGITEIWLPTDRNRPEVVRILQNMALALNLGKPELPDEPVATNSTGAAAAPNTPL